MSTARAQRLLGAPILPTIGRLAAPGVVLHAVPAEDLSVGVECEPKRVVERA